MTPNSPRSGHEGEAEVTVVLLGFARIGVDDRPAFAERVADWIGRTPSALGEVRIRALARWAPALAASTILAGSWSAGENAWVLKADKTSGLPPERVGAAQAVIRHLNGEPDAAEDIVAAHEQRAGLHGLFGLGFAALNLVVPELRAQRDDRAASPTTDQGGTT
ncbi:hypothetical protein GCM10029964_089190 [Kibdelosporangium lantanae]